MNTTLKILLHELRVTLQKKAFWFVLIGVPMVGLFAFIIITRANKSAERSASRRPKKAEPRLEGYVDAAGIIKELPEDLPADSLKEYSDQKSVQAALRRKEIGGYYLIPADYIQKGELIYVKPDVKPMETARSWVLRRALFYNLVGDEELAKKASAPMTLDEQPLIRKSAPHEEREKTPFHVPYFAALMIAVTTLMSSGYLTHSLSSEKQNRVMEILLLSCRPIQLLTGKIIALGFVGLMQAALWLGTGYALIAFMGPGVPALADLNIPPSIIWWGLGYFVLGYGVYASMSAALGAMTQNVKESGQSMFVVIFPIIAPMVLIVPMINNPEGVLTVTMSLIPFTAPVGMMVRLTAGSPPVWQILLSYVFMAVTAVFIIRSAARIFHAQQLLSGEAFSAKRYFKALFGKS